MWATVVKVASFPGLHAQLFSFAVRKAWGRPGWIYHVMHATAGVTYAGLGLACLVSPRIHIAMVARAPSMLASTAEKATWCVRKFFLVKSSHEK